MQKKKKIRFQKTVLEGYAIYSPNRFYLTFSNDDLYKILLNVLKKLIIGFYTNI